MSQKWLTAQMVNRGNNTNMPMLKDLEQTRIGHAEIPKTVAFREAEGSRK